MILNGLVGERVRANIENWLNCAIYANPACFEAFHNREKQPRWALRSWYSEFPGKYLTAVSVNYKLTRDSSIIEVGDYITEELRLAQGEDGYLGVAPQSSRMVGGVAEEFGGEANKLWDVWGHYHNMLGLLLWYGETGNETALAVCLRAADYVCSYFLDGGVNISEAGSEEMNMSSIHIFTLLYRFNKNPRYLEMIRHIEAAWREPCAGNYIELALQGREFYQMPKPRWESLHGIQAIIQLYYITGEEKYKTAFTAIWKSILKYDVHNTGGFSSGEQANGNSFDLGAIETCCSVAWTALSVDMYRLCRDSRVADEIENTFYNAILSAQHPSGRWFTYNTPMLGVKRAAFHDIGFQSFPGSPEFNCCSVNGPRAIGELANWAYFEEDGTVYLNYFGDSVIETEQAVITQKTDYPIDGNIDITVKRKKKCRVYIRIPQWSLHTRLNGTSVSPGVYAEAEGDSIRLELDFSLRVLKGENNLEGYASLYRGPLLLAYDQRYNTESTDNLPAIKADKYESLSTVGERYPKPLLLLRFETENNPVILSDMLTAGAAGTFYTTWFRLE